MRKRGLCCQSVSVRPSVRLSVTFVDCIQTAKDILKLLSQSGNPVKIFDPSADTTLQSEPLQRGV